jgi:hypothetical protein
MPMFIICYASTNFLLLRYLTAISSQQPFVSLWLFALKCIATAQYRKFTYPYISLKSSFLYNTGCFYRL